METLSYHTETDTECYTSFGYKPFLVFFFLFKFIRLTQPFLFLKYLQSLPICRGALLGDRYSLHAYKNELFVIRRLDYFNVFLLKLNFVKAA